MKRLVAASFESLGACGIHRETVRSESCNSGHQELAVYSRCTSSEVLGRQWKDQSGIFLEIFFLPLPGVLWK